MKLPILLLLDPLNRLLFRASAIVLSLAGFLTASVGEAKELLPIPAKLVVLTFDDANKSDRTFVADVLKTHGFAATFYVTEGLGFLKNKEHYTSWEEIRELHDLGFEIGNHTQYHENVARVSHEQFVASLKHIDQRCSEHGIPQPTTFCYPGFQHSLGAVRTLEGLKLQFARRGVGPEFPDSGEGARGPAYDPQSDHPLLIPTTGYAGPKWSFDDLKWAVGQARDGKICVLNFHGVPALEHPWVSTSRADFEKYMRYLKDENCTVIAMRDLANYVDPEQRPQDPYAAINRRLKQPRDLVARPVANSLGLNLNEFSLGWQLPQAGGKQAAFHVLVASDRQKLDANVGDLWDSGWRHSSQNADVLYRGAALPAGTQVWWKVRIRANNGPNENVDSGAAGEFSAASAMQTSDVPAPRPRKRTAIAEGAKPKFIEGKIAKAIEPSRHRIVFLGNTLISGMEQYGFLETALTARWPNHDLTFRNLGWPADDVFGTARSEFGSDQNTRSWQPPGGKQGFGYAVMMDQIADARPTTLIVGYGSEAAFAEGESDFKRFQEGYEALLGALETSGANLILLAPPRHEALGPPMPDPTDANSRLQRASTWIREIAKSRGHGFVELFDSLVARGTDERLTENGVHLNRLGYQRMAEAVLRQLGIQEDGPSVVVADSSQVLQSSGSRLSGVETTKHGVRFDLTADTLPSLAWTAPGRIVAAGDAALKIDGEIRLEAGAEQWSKGVSITAGPDLDQVEELRQLIVKKNELYRWRLRPLNKTYIFLFRRHEMGHLAYELDDLQRLAEEKEELIARLRAPRPHRYAWERIEAWKPPRDYPDHEVPQDIPTPDIAAELKAFTVAEDLELNLFAANPMIANPINLNWDTRGRAWVSTSSTYPHIKPGRAPNDRIVILEDTDQDGRADKSTVFAEGLLVPHSVMPVPGGAYVCSATEFLFLADHDGDDRADERRVVYSGFGNADVHHMIHGLRWAPWGELYFTQSIYINSFVETPWGNRRLNGSGIWRYRPESERLEVFARGMVNPWGHALDRWGQSFATDGAGGAGPHYAFPGAAFQTAVGAERILPGLIPGKPKNTAAEFISGRHMPERLQGSLLANDFRANRMVRYEIQERESGFAAAEVETILHSSHRSFRPVDIKMGPEGALYVVDWYNAIIDHGEVDFHHPLRDKSHGRIWRLTAKGQPALKRPRIHGAEIGALLEALAAPEEWTRVQAKRELANRDREQVLVALGKWEAALGEDADPLAVHRRLEALWLHGALRAPNAELLKRVLATSDYHARSAAVRMVSQWLPDLPDALLMLARAVEDDHPRVRLEAVNALRQIGSLEAANLALRALFFPVDQNIDYALWLTARETQDQWLPALQSGKPVFDGKLDRIAFALGAATDRRAMEPLVAMVRDGRIQGDERSSAMRTIAALGGPDEWSVVMEIAGGEPALWPAVADGAQASHLVPREASAVTKFLSHDSAPVRAAAAELCGRWKLDSAQPQLIAMVADTASLPPDRLAAARALARIGDLESLAALAVDKPLPVRTAAIAAWAGVQPSAAAAHAARLLGQIESPQDAEPVYEAFVSREEGPGALTNAIAGVQLPSAVAADGIRTALGSGRDLSALIDALTKSGSLQPVTSDMTIDERRQLLDDLQRLGDIDRGAKIFHRKELACVTCHSVGDSGGKLGPDLTSVGAYMTAESLLESLINPSTAIKQGYETVIVTRDSGVLVSGTLQRRTDTAVLIRDPGGKIVSIPNGDVGSIDTSPVSLMPQGLTARLRRDELIDLMRYLTSRGKKDEQAK